MGKNDTEVGAEKHRTALFGWMFLRLIANSERRFPGRAENATVTDETLEDEFRQIALAADTLVRDVREDIAERLAGAGADLSSLGDTPRTRAVHEFCKKVKTGDGYRALYEARVRLAGSGGPLLEWAVAVLLQERSSRQDGTAEHETLTDLLAHPPGTISGAIRSPSLYRLESAWFSGTRTLGDACVPSPWTTREPGVAFPDRDYLGLALSGGGIRSATFNLGLLQALSEKGVLDKVHFVSTVSGGGYIGGFWSAWRYHHPNSPFPAWSTDAATEGREQPAVRHLREYSRFLIPRIGFGQIETWNAIVSVLGGTVASLAVTTAGVSVVLWLALFAVYGLSRIPAWGAVAFGASTFAIHFIAERRLWTSDRLGRESTRPMVSGIGFSIVSGLAAYLCWLALPAVCASTALVSDGWFGDEHCNACAVSPPIAWAVAPIGFLLLRALASRFLRGFPAFRAALDRTIARAIACALITGLFAAIGWAAQVLSRTGHGRFAAGSVGAVGAGVFLWLRDWLAKPAEKTRGAEFLSRAQVALKPAMPKVAAYVAVVAFFVAVGTLVRSVSVGVDGRFDADGAASGLLIASLVVATALFWFDPARVGLHEFYRGRIARGFLGAAQHDEDAAGPASSSGVSRHVTIGVPRGPAVTDEQPNDDLRLGELRKRAGHAPIHLICCAANNLSGDVLGSLYRGARSAVLSPFGVTVGDYTAAQDQVSLSAALTASAAAFNSQMGAISIRVGPAVAFLMCALNLRLGLWVTHPLNPKRGSDIAPGWYFVLEALGRSRSDQVAMSRFQRPGIFSWLARVQSKLHLSDGGHFENLGLYELVRRHCRYVIVSDASADPELKFGDLGNAVRRVREDFGVEIELDVTPLKKNAAGCSYQHAIAGTIHYDGLDGIDKGLIIYFKPTFTGDEPADLVEHRARYPVFPHDGTGDQFYDEAQWESYRRLGQHCASAVLSLPVHDHPNFIEELFYLAAERWQYVEPATRDRLLDLMARRASLEASAPPRLGSEPFPEVSRAMATSPAGEEPEQTGALPAGSSNENTMADLHHLMLVVQLMEDVWRTANLESQWSQPANAPWMNYFERWADTSSFRRWWPVMRSLFDTRFAEFITGRYDLDFAPRAGDRAYVEVEKVSFEELIRTAHFALQRRLRQRPGRQYLRLTLHIEDGLHAPGVVVAALVHDRQDGVALAPTVVTWSPEDYIIHAVLQRGGISRHCIESLTGYFAAHGVDELRVLLVGTDAGAWNARDTGRRRTTLPGPASPRVELRSPGDRRALVEAIAVYKSHGFAYCTAQSSTSPNVPSYLGVRAADWLVKPLRSGRGEGTAEQAAAQ